MRLSNVALLAGVLAAGNDMAPPALANTRREPQPARKAPRKSGTPGRAFKGSPATQALRIAKAEAKRARKAEKRLLDRAHL